MDLLIHIVDDDEGICSTFDRLLVQQGHRTVVSRTGQEALQQLRGATPDLMILDLSLPDTSGIDILREIRSRDIGMPIVMVSGYGTVETAVEALKLGAWDFLTKPLDKAKVESTIQNILTRVRLEKEVKHIRNEQQSHFLTQHIIGQDTVIKRCYSLALSAAQNDRLNILITGESGTGKEFLARYVHYHSPRSTKPLVTVNCSAIPRELVESELFGYEKGAFTGAATAGKQGRFELAEEGTLFLDEIGDLQLEAQSKILRFLQEKELQRVGSPHTKRLDVRIIAATNQDLEDFVRTGQFREDLYYRLNVMRIHLPPLRERREDISLFALHFINVFNREFGKKILGLMPDVEDTLVRYEWPGNIRELRNVIERAVHLAPGPYLTGGILPEDRPAPPPPAPDSPADEPVSLQEMERRYVSEILESVGGNKSKAAKVLCISRARLRRILEDTGSNA